MAFEIKDPRQSATQRDAQYKYAVVADPVEQEIDIEEAYEAIICTGDLLNFAPAPNASEELVENSMLGEYGENVEQPYAEKDVGRILEEVDRVKRRRDVIGEAISRYGAFFDSIDEPVYYVMGNQDIPRALEQAAEQREDVVHAGDLDGVTAVDGLVPEFAAIPGTGYFPCEIELDEYYSTLERAEEREMLVSHTLPQAGLGAFGFDIVLGSKRDRSPRSVSDTVAALGPHWAGDYVLLEEQR